MNNSNVVWRVQNCRHCLATPSRFAGDALTRVDVSLAVCMRVCVCVCVCVCDTVTCKS